MAVPEVVVDGKISDFPFHLHSDLVHGRVQPLCELLLHHAWPQHALDLPLSEVRPIVVNCPASAEVRSTMEHQRGVTPHWMIVDQGVSVLLPASHHPQPVPQRLRLRILHLVKLLQRYEPCLPSLADRVEVHGLVLERHGLEGAVNVPACTPYVGAALILVVGNSKYIGVWAPGVLVEGAFHLSQLLRNLHLPRATDLALSLEDQYAVFPHIILDPVDQSLRQRVLACKRKARDVGAKVRKDRLESVGLRRADVSVTFRQGLRLRTHRAEISSCVDRPTGHRSRDCGWCL
mmetsp:Transcript_5332/g.12253  ORF Transcript_5332/g.12253 Transcript_5332/m.12253 type:complete len:290 (+) Transcript_5332:215-1084(+)